MFAKHYTYVQAKKVEDGADNTTIRWLIDESHDAPNFYMRLIEVEPGGHTQKHEHEWEHEVFILEGEGALVGNNNTLPLRSGVFAFVPGNEKHYFECVGGKTMKMLCIIPAKK